MGKIRTILVGSLLSCSIGCSAVGESTGEGPTGVLRQDQVPFYERPTTLAAIRKSGSPRPLIVLLESDPRAMVIGAESPTFALYDDGLFIQRNATGFRSGRLTPPELAGLVEALKIDALTSLYGRYDAELAMTDQPEEHLLLYTEENPIFISVYGSLKDGEVRSRVPKPVVDAYDTLLAFDHLRTTSWLPADVEVMIWPYDYAPDASIKWPSEWPGLTDAKTIKRGEGSFSIFMSSAKLHEIQAFLKKQSVRGAVEIDGRKWSVSVRYPFPHEKLWLGPNPDLEQAKH